jgi:hypothetical protein
MSLSPELKASYQIVVKDLEQKRVVTHADVVAGQKRLRDLDEKITGLYREMGVPLPAPALVLRKNEAAMQPDQKYALISVHWAILHLLSEAKSGMTSAEIADALTNAGVKTKAANFTNNVSAVLSTNMRPKGEEEAELVDGKWTLTELGRNKIAFIVVSPKFRRACPWVTAGAA